MAGSAGVEQVYPRPGGSSPASGSGGTGGSGGGIRLGQRELMIGGAVAVVGIALLSRSRAGGDVSSEEDDETTVSGFEIDTRDTDLYNELQPELEAIQDAIVGLAKPPAASPKPTPPKPTPRTPPNQYHTVRRGESLTSIARKYRTTRAHLWQLNKALLDSVARSHGKRSSNGGRILYPGTAIRVPKQRR